MCGIIGYVGPQAAGPILLEGLHRLEYRGYDSSGIAVLDRDGALAILKRAGKLAELRSHIEAPPPGQVGIGHTRWATHGDVVDLNAHPHVSSNGEVVVVHNGIVENYRALRDRLAAAGLRCTTQTDTEVIPQLISLYLRERDDFRAALQRTLAELQGGNAIVAMYRRQPDRLFAARLGNAGGIVLGFGGEEMFVASDLPALLPHTTRVRFLEEGEVAEITGGGARVWNREGAEVAVEPQTVSLNPLAAMKGPYRHFMLKEIREQPRALSDTIRGRAHLNPPGVWLEDLPYSDADLRRIGRVLIIGMGSSLHAALIGRAYFERLAGLPTDCDNASEFRYREPVLGPETLVVSVSQSGETVDTLAAMAQVKTAWGAPQITICNVVGAESTRIAEGAAVYLRCGPEIGVASSKCFTASMAALYLLACRVGRARGHLSEADLEAALEALLTVPSLIDAVLHRSAAAAAVARALQDAEHLLYIGRGLQYPIALEGALKCKEISYIHAEAYPAGEMKHGPIALIDKRMPVVAIALQDPLYEKMCSTIQQVKTRDGTVVALGTEGDHQLARQADHFLALPPAAPLIAPFVTAVAVQLIAYDLALLRGADVDQPRNLAKTVTVE